MDEWLNKGGESVRVLNWIDVLLLKSVAFMTARLYRYGSKRLPVRIAGSVSAEHISNLTRSQSALDHQVGPFLHGTAWLDP
jgi:hypothetical protein